MSIKIIKPRTARGVLDQLAKLAANRNYVFRGHQDSNYRLQSTLMRFVGQNVNQEFLKHLIIRFRTGLASIGKLPTERLNNHDWLEYARHYGLPSPCIDLTYSPYVALFFAVSGMTKDSSCTVNNHNHSAIYAIDIEKLAHMRAIYSYQTRGIDFRDSFKNFMNPDYDIFCKDTFPLDTLQFCPLPSKTNTRMQRQCGCFIYDTLNYADLGVDDLEDYIEKSEEPNETNTDGSIKEKFTAIKIFIPKKKIAGELITHLELMGVQGRFLYDNPEGVAIDTANSFFADSRTLYCRD